MQRELNTAFELDAAEACRVASEKRYRDIMYSKELDKLWAKYNPPEMFEIEKKKLQEKWQTNKYLKKADRVQC